MARRRSGRWLALDVGERRVGVAVSDPTGLVATPLATIRRVQGGDATKLGQLVREQCAVGIVVGLPLHMDGAESRQALRVRRYAEVLEASLRAGGFEGPLVLWDERLSTQSRGATDGGWEEACPAPGSDRCGCCGRDSTRVLGQRNADWGGPLIWLRSLLRVVVFVGAIAAITLMAVAAVQVFTNLPAGGAQPGRGRAVQPFKASAWTRPAICGQPAVELPQGGSRYAESWRPGHGRICGEPRRDHADVAQHLYEQGFVEDPQLFAQLMRYLNLDASLEAGEYGLRRNMTPREVAEALQHPRTEGVVVTIPEGWRAEQVAYVLEQAGLVTAAAFMDEVRGGQHDYPWLAGRPLGHSLEGFLFPDTYEFPKEVTAAEIVSRMLANLDSKITPEMLAVAEAHGMTFYEVVTLASIVERESVIAEERRVIASVYKNRLNVQFFTEAAGYLAADPTVQYAKGYDPATDSWWTPMSMTDSQTVESPYNTFKYQGLPPGPICSPGLAAIEATLYPADTDYLYFFSKGDGSHAFASTLAEHLENQAKYGYSP